MSCRKCGNKEDGPTLDRRETALHTILAVSVISGVPPREILAKITDLARMGLK